MNVPWTLITAPTTRSASTPLRPSDANVYPVNTTINAACFRKYENKSTTVLI